jgi:hypothetical protein
MEYDEQQKDLLMDLAKTYIWWKTPEEAMLFPTRIMAQVMNIGDYSDVQKMVHSVGKDKLREVIKNAEIGQFNARSWHYWNYRLGLATIDTMPDMPSRRFGA